MKGYKHMWLFFLILIGVMFGGIFTGYSDRRASDLLYNRRINSLSYDTVKELLSITFRNGSTQDYCKVPGKVYRKLKSASDQNKYYSRNIYGNYQLG